MAKKASRSGRRLIVFALLTALLYRGVALSGDWTPKPVSTCRVAPASRWRRAPRPGRTSPRAARGGPRHHRPAGQRPRRGRGRGGRSGRPQHRGRDPRSEAQGPRRVGPADRSAPLPPRRGGRGGACQPAAPAEPSSSPSGTPSAVALAASRASSQASPPREAQEPRHLGWSGRRRQEEGQEVEEAVSGTPALRGAVSRAGDPSGVGEGRARRPAAQVDGQPGPGWLQKFTEFTCPRRARPPSPGGHQDQPLSPATRTA